MIYELSAILQIGAATYWGLQQDGFISKVFISSLNKKIGDIENNFNSRESEILKPLHEFKKNIDNNSVVKTETQNEINSRILILTSFKEKFIERKNELKPENIFNFSDLLISNIVFCFISLSLGGIEHFYLNFVNEKWVLIFIFLLNLGWHITMLVQFYDIIKLGKLNFTKSFNLSLLFFSVFFMVFIIILIFSFRTEINILLTNLQFIIALYFIINTCLPFYFIYNTINKKIKNLYHLLKSDTEVILKNLKDSADKTKDGFLSILSTKQ